MPPEARARATRPRKTRCLRAASRAGLLAALLLPISAHAAQWFRKQIPDAVTATCTIAPAQAEYHSAPHLKARIEAVDSKKHPLAYVWSSNGGLIVGNGAAVDVDVSRLNPGSYRLVGVAQDAYKNRAECAADFQIVAPPEPLTARCFAEPAEAAVGKPVELRLDSAAPEQGHALRYQWFANGGALRQNGAEATLDSDDMVPGEYSVTGRVDDDLGRAADCRVMVKIVPPPPPPPPPEVQNLAQILFPRNSAQLGARERQQLERVLDRLREDSAGSISVEAYAGPDEKLPKELAAARAASIRYVLAGQGVDDTRIRVHVGLGGRLGGVRNRTVDIIWVPAGMEY